MKKYLLAASLLLGCGTVAAAADTYELDPTHTYPHFAIDHLGFSVMRGQFNESAGTATLDLDAKTGSVSVTVDVASLSTGHDKRDEHLLGPDFFDVENFPTMHFQSTSFEFKNKELKAIAGVLDMHGQKHPLTLKVDRFVCKQHPMRKKQACGIDLSGTLKRSQWGMTGYLPALGDEVRLSIEAEAFLK